MKKLIMVSFLLLLGIILLSGCTTDQGNLQNVGMLMENAIDDEAWERKAYQGLLEISDEFDVDIYYEENIQTKYEIIHAVDKFVQDGVNLIFGHSNMYGKYFMDIAASYPDVHFVYLNGTSFEDNVTSLQINSYAMAFFGGMIANEMTETNQVGIIAAYEWQAEIEGFYDGVKYQDSSTNVHINYINNWNDKRKALEMYAEMKENNVDVFYPAGDSFSRDVIQHASEDGLYVIGYLSDQFEIAPSVVLTSTVEHVDKLYQLVAGKYNKNELEGGVLPFDFQDGIITLGEFNPDISKQFQKSMKQEIDEYKKTGVLPDNQ